jgi:hypothetical protein
VWSGFYNAWADSPAKPVEAAAWLDPAVLQLTDKLLGDQVSNANGWISVMRENIYVWKT